LLIVRRECNNAVAQPLLISRLCAREPAAMNKNRRTAAFISNASGQHFACTVKLQRMLDRSLQVDRSPVMFWAYDSLTRFPELVPKTTGIRFIR
jgi:hypothetical protein